MGRDIINASFNAISSCTGTGRPVCPYCIQHTTGLLLCYCGKHFFLSRLSHHRPQWIFGTNFGGTDLSGPGWVQPAEEWGLDQAQIPGPRPAPLLPGHHSPIHFPFSLSLHIGPFAPARDCWIKVLHVLFCYPLFLNCNHLGREHLSLSLLLDGKAPLQNIWFNSKVI